MTTLKSIGKEQQKQNPMTPEQLVAEFKDLARYGAKQAKKVAPLDDRTLSA